MLTNLILILLLPLAGFAIQIFFGGKLPRKGDWVPTGLMGVALLLATITFIRALGIFDPNLKRVFHWSWIKVGDFTAGIGDPLRQP